MMIGKSVHVLEQLGQKGFEGLRLKEYLQSPAKPSKVLCLCSTRKSHSSGLEYARSAPTFMQFANSCGMEMSSTSNVLLLEDLMKGLTQDNNDALLEQGVCALLGLADGSLENVATRLGLNQTKDWRQIGVYIFTMAAIQESLQVIGLGAGVIQLNFSGFELAQIKHLVEEANRKLDVVITAPLKVAIDYFDRAIINLKNANMSGVIKEMEKAKENAIQAYQYAKGQGATMEDLWNCVKAKQLTICAEVL